MGTRETPEALGMKTGERVIKEVAGRMTLRHPEGAYQNLSKAGRRGSSCGAASGDSPRRDPWDRRMGHRQAPAGAKEIFRSHVLSPLRGTLSLLPFPHGSRRGLASIATPWLSTA